MMVWFGPEEMVLDADVDLVLICLEIGAFCGDGFVLCEMSRQSEILLSFVF